MLAEVWAALHQLPPSAMIIVSIVACLMIAVLARVLSNTFHGNAPPVDEGIPFIGGLLKFSKGPWDLMTEMYEKHGEVFTVPLLHKKMTFLFGPHASPHFFNATDDKMSQTEVYNFNVPTFGPGVVYDVDVKVRSEQFRIVGDALRSNKLKSYVPQFRQEAEEYFSKWGETGVVNFPDVFGELIILTASRTLLGREVREHMFTKVADLYHDLDDGMRPLSVIFPYAPTPYHRRRDAARLALADIFRKVIAARRASGVKEADMLQVLIDAKYQKVNGGRQLNDEEITGLLIAILFAGQHTSTITSSWTGLRMLDNKSTAFEAAVKEQQEFISKYGDAIDFDILNSLDVLHRNIHEALRLGPPLIMVMRLAKESFEVKTSAGKQYVIPKGHIVAASPTFSHRLKHVFKNADHYEPDRFLPPREEQNGMPFSYLGFGGGRHACMGQQFAMLQIKTIWTILLRNFDFEMLDPFPDPDFTSMVIGPKPCRVKYTRRKLSPS
jgi:sterol 14-demethylase